MTIEQIKSDVEAILVHSQDYPFDLNIEPLINQWYEAKKPFIKMFGGSTMWRTHNPIKVELTKEQRSRKFNDFILALDEEGILTEDFETFLRNNEEGFFLNKVLLPYPSKDVKLGSKLSKNFKKFLPNQETTRLAQDMASRYIQENKIEGYLCLSVDPRDFLTLSENNEKWWSCQSLDGDYRSGCLSYMVDNVTFVAYLASNVPCHFKALPQDMEWYSKKWRMLVHTDRDNYLYYNKQYPYTSDALLDIAQWIITSRIPRGLSDPLFTKPETVGFKSITIDNESSMLPINQITLGGRLFNTMDVIDTSDYLGYCDLTHSSSYTPVLSMRNNVLDRYRYKFGMGITSLPLAQELREFKKIAGPKIGEKVICPACGKGILRRGDSMLCPNCIVEHDADEDFYLTCKGCHHRIYDEDEIYFIDDKPYCKSCHQAILYEDYSGLFNESEDK